MVHSVFTWTHYKLKAACVGNVERDLFEGVGASLLFFHTAHAHNP